MPLASHWDRLPPELRSPIIDDAGPLTQWTTGRIDKTRVSRSVGEAVWAQAIACDWQGNLSTLPASSVSVEAFWPLRCRGLFERIQALGRAGLAEGLRHAAARNGWTSDLGTTKPANVAALAAAAGALELLKSAVRERGGARIPERAVSNAIRSGHVDVLEWIHGQEPHSAELRTAIDVAAEHGRLEAVEWLHRNKVGFGSGSAMDKAAANGHLAVVRFLHHNRIYGCTVAALRDAILNCHFDVADFLYQHRSEGCGLDTQALAARNNNLAALAWLNRNDLPGWDAGVMGIALVCRNFDAVKWLHAHRHEGCSADAICEAVEYAELDDLKWLHKHLRAFDPDSCLDQMSNITHIIRVH